MRLSLFCLLILSLFSCKQEVSIFSPIDYPDDNPHNNEIAQFGEQLFFDKRLSKDNSVSCATCHKPEFAFADTSAISPGVEGRLGIRNAPTLLNVAYKEALMLDGAVQNLEMQAIVPIQDHNEMAISMGELVKKLRKIKEYNKLSKDLFSRELDAYVLTRALANYERTLISNSTRFDDFYYSKNEGALSEREKKGWHLFQQKQCVSCHTLPHFSTYSFSKSGFKLDNKDWGRYRITGDSADIGKFVIPTLRNISRTKPYLHNGSYKSLELVIQEHYYNKNVLPSNLEYQEVSKREAILIAMFLNSLEEKK